MLSATNQLYRECNTALMEASRDERSAIAPSYDKTPIDELAAELGLLVRLPASYDAVVDLARITRLMCLVIGRETPTRADRKDWTADWYVSYTKAVETFEDAIRTELGRPAINREIVWVDFDSD